MLKIVLRQIIKPSHKIISTIYTIPRYSSTYKAWKTVKMDNRASSRDNPIIMKLDSPEFKSIFTPELQSLVEIFKKYDYKLRIAGGAVRDILMGKKPDDLDFATDATPCEMLEFFAKEEIRIINDNGLSHGTVTARINDKDNFEITTLRIDTMTDGRHAKTEFVKDWKLDANRRDLTINSMFLDLEGNVYDYFYGYEDLQKKRILFVGDPSSRICEDYLRILRYFRFYGRIMDNADVHDETTIKAIKENIGGLERISGERIWAEWSKILEGNFAMEMTLKMIECGSSVYIGLPAEPNVENFKIVCQRASSNNIKLKPISMIVSMLKDVPDVIHLFERLKLSNFHRDLALFLIKHRDSKLYQTSLKSCQYLIFDQAKHRYDVYREYVKEILKYQGAIQILNEFEKWIIPRFPVDGNMLKQYVTGTKIGLVLRKLQKIWVEEDFEPTSEQLLKHVPRIISELDNKIN